MEMIFVFTIFLSLFYLSSKVSQQIQQISDFFHAIFTSVYSMLIFMYLNNNIVDIEKPDGICSPTLTVDDL